MRPVSRSLAAAAVLCLAGAACAGQSTGTFNTPISFAQPGSVTLTLESSVGGFDHILELAATAGAVGAAPLMALTEIGGQPSATVLGVAPAQVGDSVAVGLFDAAEELVFRLTNVGSDRLGTPGEVAGQVFTGSASALNPQPGFYYSWVEWLSPTQVRVQIEDLFPVDPQGQPAGLDGPDVQFLLALSPVPEPDQAALLWLGLAALGAGLRLRRSRI